MAADAAEIENNNAIIALQQSAILERQKAFQAQERERNNNCIFFLLEQKKLSDDKALILERKKALFENVKDLTDDQEEQISDEEKLFKDQKKNFDKEKDNLKNQKDLEKLKKDLQDERERITQEELEDLIEREKDLREQYRNNSLNGKMLDKAQDDVNKRIYGSLGDKDGKVFGGKSFAANMELFRKDSTAYVNMVSQRFKDKMLSPFRKAKNVVGNIWSGAKFGAKFIGSLFRNTKKSSEEGAVKLAGIQAEEEKQRKEKLDKDVRSDLGKRFKVKDSKKKKGKSGEPESDEDSGSSSFGSEAEQRLNEETGVKTEKPSSVESGLDNTHLENIDKTTSDILNIISGGKKEPEGGAVSPEQQTSPVGEAMAATGAGAVVGAAMLASAGVETPEPVDTSISSADTSITSDADMVDEALDQEEYHNTVEDYLKQIASNTGEGGEEPTIKVENMQEEGGGGIMDMFGGILGDFFGKMGGSMTKHLIRPLLGKFGSLAKMAFSGPGLAVAGIAIGAAMMAKDAFDGVKKAKEWGTSKTAAGAAGAIAGTGPGIGEGSAGDIAKSAGKNALKWGAMGAGIGFFIGGPLGSAVGGAIGAGLGAITAAIGPKRIAKAFDKIGTGLKVFGKGYINSYKMIGKTFVSGIKLIGNTYKAVGKAGAALAKGYAKTGWALAKGAAKTADNVLSTASKGIGWFGKSVGNIVGGAFDGFKKGGLKGLFSGAKEGVKKSIDEGKTIITDAVKAQKDIVKETAGEVKSIAKETMGEVKNVASEYVKDQKEIVKDTIDYGKELVKDTLSPLEEEKKKAKEGAEKISETVENSVPNDGSLEKSGKVIKGAMVGFSDIGERNLEAQEANISELSAVAKVKEKETNSVTGENTDVIAENNNLLKDAKKEKEFKQLSQEQIDNILKKNQEAYKDYKAPSGNGSKDIDPSLAKNDPAKLRQLMESNNVQLSDSDAVFEDAETKRTVLKNSIISQNLSGQISEAEAEVALKAIQDASDDTILKLNDSKEDLPPTSQKPQNQEQQPQNKVDRLDRETNKILQEHEAKKPETIVVTTPTYIQQNKTDYFGRQPYAVPGM